MTIPKPGAAGLDELRRAELVDEDSDWPAHWRKVGCYCVAVEVAGVPYLMLNTESDVGMYDRLADMDPSAKHWVFFRTIEEADDFVKVEAVKKRLSQ